MRVGKRGRQKRKRDKTRVWWEGRMIPRVQEVFFFGGVEEDSETVEVGE